MKRTQTVKPFELIWDLPAEMSDAGSVGAGKRLDRPIFPNSAGTSLTIGRSALRRQSVTNKLLPIVWALGTAVLLCGSGCQSGAYGQFISVESDRQFDQVALKDDRPVLLQVYRNGCLRCVFLAGTLSDLSKEYGDRVGFYKIERDQAARVRYRYGVGSYPTVILFVSGQERARWVAEWDTSVYRKAIEAAFAELNGEAPDRPSSSSGSEGPPPVPVSRSLPGACSVGLRDGENDVNSPGLCSEY